MPVAAASCGSQEPEARRAWRSSWPALLVLVCLGCSAGAHKAAAPAATGATTELDNLVAFARLYGYVKYFYPGDEAAALDWQRFAVYGARKVRPARDRSELLALLRDLFRPTHPAASRRDRARTRALRRVDRVRR